MFIYLQKYVNWKKLQITLFKISFLSLFLHLMFLVPLVMSNNEHFIVKWSSEVMVHSSDK